MGRQIFFFKLDLKWVFYSKKVEFLASNIIIWTKFLIGTPLGPIGHGSPTQIEGGQISWLLPSEPPFFIFFGGFLVVKFINHLEFFTDFISFNQAPCSRSKNQYKLGACQKMQNYIFFSNQNIYLYISITELSCIFFHVKKHLTSTKDACEKWWIVQFTISRVNNVPDIGGKPSK